MTHTDPGKDWKDPYPHPAANTPSPPTARSSSLPTRYAPAELETPPTGIVLAGVEDDAMFDFDLAAQNFESFEMK
jgi:hypothetical protein